MLSARVLSDLMKAKIDALDIGDEDDPIDASDRAFLALAEAIVEHIKDAAEVVDVTVVGVQSGPGTATNVTPGKVQ